MVTGSSGGSGAVGGFRFETQVGALLAAYTLAEHQLHPELTKGWPRGASSPTHIGLETGYHVDDVAVFTQDTGLIVIQAKKGLRLLADPKSPLADALQQAVQMFRSGRPTTESDHDWNAITDRIVIATDAGAPRSMREDLVKVVARLATSHALTSEDQLANSVGERKALDIFNDHVRRLWRKETGSDITTDEFRAFCSVFRVMAFDLQPQGRDLLNVRAVLSGVLVEQTQISAAWTTLLSVCQDLAADRQFVTSSDLRAILAANRIRAKIVEHGAADVGPVFVPEAVLSGPITSGVLQARIAEADELRHTDARAAAELYVSVIAELESSGYSHVATGLVSRLTQALRASDQHRAAVRAAVATAWRPVPLGDVPSGIPDEYVLEEELRSSPEHMSRSGQSVVAVLRYEAGEVSLADVATQITLLEDTDEHSGELLLWLAEEAVASQQQDLFAPLCDHALALAAAAGAEDTEFAGRLRIAVAECREEWPALLATIEADHGAPMYVLAQARYGQALTWRNELAEATKHYEEAIKRGTEEHMYAEVRRWLYDIRALRSAVYGTGSRHDTHFTAQSLPAEHKVSVFAGEQRLVARGLEVLAAGKHDRAHRIFTRLRHRMAAGAALLDQRQCDGHLATALAGMNVPDRAVIYFLRSGDYKQASKLVRQQPDKPLVPNEGWFSGPVWQTRAAYELLGEHGDLVPAQAAQRLFDQLAAQLITTGTIHGWSNFQANETLFKPLAALIWASSTKSAGRLLKQLAPIAERGGPRRVVQSHMDLLLGCARVHPTLVFKAAQQFVDLVLSSDYALPDPLHVALQNLVPEWTYLSERLLASFSEGKAPWVVSVLVELGVRAQAVVDHVNSTLTSAAKPRTYEPNTTSFGSNVIEIARLSHGGSAEQRAQFVGAMLDIALEPRESYSGQREAIDAIAVVTQQRGAASFPAKLRTRIHEAISPLASGQVTTHIDDDITSPFMGSPSTVMLAASRLLLRLSEDDEDRARLIQSVLFTLLDDVDAPQLLSSALAQVDPALFQHHLLVLATSRFPAIRALAAHYWAALPSVDHAVGRKLAGDPVGTVRLALAHGLNEHGRPDANDIAASLKQDCRFSIRAAIGVGSNSKQP